MLISLTFLVMEANIEIPKQNLAVDGTDGREACPKYWIALYTRPNSEKKAAKELSKIKNLCVDTFIPIKSEIKLWSDRKKKVDTILIPMVIFIQVVSLNILPIIKHPLIIRHLSIPGQKAPAIIPQEQVERLKFIVDECDNISFTRGDFCTGDMVRIIRGNLRGLVGYVSRQNHNTSRLNINIDYLGCASIEININDIEPVKL